ncbi:MAG: hypothetical protein J0647_04145 [Campylobacteraceae bacterium]|nr:hypothetical protein [Campylobacteraceae bacterium]
MVKSENFIYFFTICGFFIGLMFSILNFSEAENILFYTFEITLFFYLTIHVAVMNFFDFNRIGKLIFNKKEHESISEYFIQELDAREKVMEGLLVSIDNMNQKYEKIMKGSIEIDESHDKKAA